MGRSTVTGMITTAGKQFEDWTSVYRLFSKSRVEPDNLFAIVRRGILEELPPDAPFVCAMDDSVWQKTGKKTYGVAFRRDPMSPAFLVNFILGLRFLQISAAVPTGEIPCSSRMIPISFQHCPTPKKPKKKDSEEKWIEYRLAKKLKAISREGVNYLAALRRALDSDALGKNRQLIVAVDGTFTNCTVMQNLPERTCLIGRMRQDSNLYYPPDDEDRKRTGRKLVYGKKAPTPKNLLDDSDIPFEKCPVHAAGRKHQFTFKSIGPVRWRKAGNRDLRVVVIAPLEYRLSKKSHLLYREPAFLICTDPNLSIEQIIQYYVWRVEIELNIRDEKTIIGVGQAQVRNPKSVEKVPAFVTASYSMMLLAARRAMGPKELIRDALPLAKWRGRKPPRRASTQQILNHMKREMWGEKMRIKSFSDFATICGNTSWEKLRPQLQSAVLYTQN
jgi:hypothetical protein